MTGQAVSSKNKMVIGYNLNAGKENLFIKRRGKRADVGLQ
jgi:hypothetical protein